MSSLSSKLDDVKCYLDSRAPSTPSTSYASTVLNGMSMQPAVSVTKPLPITQETSVRGPNGDRNYDRKFNLVISGLSECAKGTKKQERVSHDITELVSALSEIDININGDSISYLYRLGK